MANGPQIGTAWVHIVPSFDGMGASIKQQFSGIDSHAKGAFSRWGNSAKSILGNSITAAAKIGGAALAGMTAYMASYAGEALAASDSAQKFASTLEFAGIDDSKIKALTESTKKYAAETVYDISDIRNTTAALAANGVQGYEQLAQAAGNLNAVAGGNADTFKTVGSVMTQTAGAGKLVTENWNQLRDAIPGASKRIKDALQAAGAYTGDFNDAMAKGQITAEEFNKAIMDLGFEEAAIKAASSTATFEGAWGNFQATISDGLAGIIDLFKGGLTGSITAASDALGAFFTNAQNVIKGVQSFFATGELIPELGVGNLSPVADFLRDLRNHAEAFKTALIPIGGLAVGALGPLLSGLPVVGGAFAGLTGPVGLVIGAFGALLVKSQAFRDGLAAVGSALAESFTAFLPLMEPVASSISLIVSMLGKTLGDALQTVAPLIGDLVSALAGGLSGAFQAIVPMIQPVMQVFDALVDALMNIVQAVLPPFTQAVGAIGEIFADLFNKLQPVISQLAETLTPVIQTVGSLFAEIGAQVMDAVNGLLPVFAGVVGAFGELVAAVMPFVAVLADVLQPLIENLQPVVSTVFEAIKNVITAVLNVIKGIIQTWTAVLKGDWSGAWDSIKNTAAAVWDLIKGIIGGVLKIILSVLQAQMNNAKALMVSVWETIKGGVSAAWEGIKSSISNGVNAAYNYVVDLKNRVVGFFSGAGSWLWSAGQSIINGLIDGIYSAFARVRAALGELTSMLPDWKGPAEVDRVILKKPGELVMGGFIDAMESRYKDAQKSLGNFTKSLSADVDVNAKWSPGGVQPAAVGGVHITQNIAVANVPDASAEASRAAEEARFFGVGV